MISVIVPTRDSAATLAACLSALVRAAVDGLVREVIVADDGSTDATLEIAEDAGAKVVATIDEAVKIAKSDWLLVLSPLARLENGWAAEVSLHIDRNPSKAACFRLAHEDGGRPLESWLSGFGAPREEQGLLIPTARYGGAFAIRRLNSRAFVL